MISKKTYEKLISQYGKDVRSLNSQIGINMEDDGFLIPISDDDRIISCREYKLMLYRHWSIFESMCNSSYVGARFGIWKDKSREKMKMLLAQMGIPLEECYQNYENMKISAKEDLEKKMETYAKYFKLDEIFYNSFYKVI